MAVNWNRIAEQNPANVVSDFQKAALRLVAEQIIYQANPRQRTDYDLIVKYENEFTQVLDLLGCRLDHNKQERYIATVPLYPEVSKIKMMHTLLALVLRKLYDHHMNQGSLNAGIAGVGLPELEVAFNESTGRVLPMKPQNELMDMLDAMKRWGIARSVKSDNFGEVTYFVEILPGIQSLINQSSLSMLKDHAHLLYELDSDAQD